MFPKPAGLPHFCQVFSTVETRLQERIKHDLTEDHVRGFDEFFAFLQKASEQFQVVQSIRPLTVLVARLRKDFETALVSFVVGMDQAAFDAMRDGMEIGYLLRDFTLDAGRIPEWLSLADKERWNRFGPNALRQRFASRQGIAVTDLLDSKEYCAHSSMLHVSPYEDGFVERGVSRSPRPEFGASFALADILHHACDTVFLLTSFVAAFSGGQKKDDTTGFVPHLRVAFEHTMKRYTNALMWIDMAKAVAEHRAQASNDSHRLGGHITNG